MRLPSLTAHRLLPLLLVALKKLPANLRSHVEKQSTIRILKLIKNGLLWELAPRHDVHLLTKVSIRFQISVKHRLQPLKSYTALAQM